MAPPAALAAEPPKDVNAIFESLKQFDWSGFGFNFGSSGGGIPGLTETAPARVEVKPPPELVPQPVIKNTPELKALSVPIRPIVLASHHPTLKERQESIIEQLYRSDDLQCKSCGVRFSKDEMPQYTSHLDWHFRYFVIILEIDINNILILELPKLSCPPKYFLRKKHK